MENPSVRCKEPHRRLMRLKLDRKTTQCLRPSCCTTSACTLGVAVAVNASRGTVGYLHVHQGARQGGWCINR